MTTTATMYMHTVQLNTKGHQLLLDCLNVSRKEEEKILIQVELVSSCSLF